jgi:hypothetical protein
VNTANSISLIVALIAAVVAILGYAINQLQLRRERRARVFAEALAAALDYIQMPYIIGTRSMPPRDLDPKDRALAEVSTRREIGNRLREVQARLYFHQSLIQLESVQVAKAFDRLVLQARLTGSVARKEAWRKPPIASDEDFTIQWSFRFPSVEEAWRNCIIAMRRRLGFGFRGGIAIEGIAPPFAIPSEEGLASAFHEVWVADASGYARSPLKQGECGCLKVAVPA